MVPYLVGVVRGVGGVCDMCMRLARGGVGVVGGERIGFGLYQFWRNMGKVGYVSVFWCRGVGVGERVRCGLGQGLGGCILGAPSVQSCCALTISDSNWYLSVADIANPDLFACGSQTWISFYMARFYEEHCQPSSGSTWPACPKR